MEALGITEFQLGEDADHPGAQVSEAIRIARVICIFFMIFVHLHPGTAEFARDEASLRLFDVIRFFIVDSFGRASVALLSVVAGYLAVYSLRRESMRTFVSKKTRSLVVPFLLWNATIIALVVISAQWHDDFIQRSFDTALNLDSLPALMLGWGGDPANDPLSFLRDIFVCALFTPLLIATLRRNTHAFMAVTLVMCLGALLAPLDMPLTIPALYAAGVYIAVRGVPPVPTTKTVLVALVAFLAIGAAVTWRDLTSEDEFASGLTWLEAGFYAIRLPAAIVFWAVALYLCGTAIGKQLQRLEPYIFIAFCTHLIVSKAVWASWQPMFGGYYGTLYPVFFFGIPVLVMVLAVYGSRIANARVPWLFSLLNGGRNLATRRRTATAAAASGIYLEPART